MPIIVLKSKQIINLSESQYAKFFQAMFLANTDITFKLNGIKFKLSDIEDNFDKAMNTMKEN